MADKPDLAKLKNELAHVKQFLPATGSEDQKWSFSNQKNYDGYSIAGEVQYLAQVSSFREKGLEYNGAMKVYSNYLGIPFYDSKDSRTSGCLWSKLWVFQGRSFYHGILQGSQDLRRVLVLFLKR